MPQKQFSTVSEDFLKFPNVSREIAYIFINLRQFSQKFRRCRHGINQLCNAFSWDTAENATCHFYFLRIHTRLKARVYTENISDAWHIPRYPTRKRCITTIYPMPEKIQPIRGQDCRCIFCGMQRVVFTRPSRHYLRNTTMFYNMDSSLISNSLIKIIDSYGSFRLIPIISDHLRPFPNTSEDFPKIFENRKNALKTVLNHFRSFPKMSEHFQRFPIIFRKFRKVLKIPQKRF